MQEANNEQTITDSFTTTNGFFQPLVAKKNTKKITIK